MKDLKCPSCGKTFKIDPTSYDDLLSQIRDDEFNKQINEYKNFAELIKNKEIDNKKKDFQILLENQKKKLEQNIFNLKSEINYAKLDKNNALKEIKNISEKELLNLKNQIEILKKELAMQSEIKKHHHDKEILDIQNKSDKEKNELKISYEKLKHEKSISEKAIEEKYSIIIKERDAALQRERDMKLKLSTKMQGESLEKHCENEFNKIRATAFPNSYFEKDNDSSSGSKGDYIFKENDNENIEIISIMFDMKNESFLTEKKHKNEEFFKKLDRDRREKSCEYAILVSLLEQDSELYNSGIVDVSWKFPKMYVIRPQFFIPIITLLRNAAINSLKYKKELSIERTKRLDITNFENNLEQFKNAFNTNVKHAKQKFEYAIEGIDKSIKQLEDIKKNLLTTQLHLDRANKKSESLSIKKLTSNNPTMQNEFKKANKKSI
tara:strand:+ start:25018 stop:26328 length:1311 start_codon:yes stop_codon:yes gene_type:complete